MRAALAAVAAGLLAAAAVACSASQRQPEKAAYTAVPDRDQRVDEIQALWMQIRDWRRQAGMPLDPSPRSEREMRMQPLASAVRTCPSDHEPATPVCQDVCSLADAICENADSICRIAEELPGDAWAQSKCSSAKASCKEAKERCCACEAGDAGAAEVEDDEAPATTLP